MELQRSFLGGHLTLSLSVLVWEMRTSAVILRSHVRITGGGVCVRGFARADPQEVLEPPLYPKGGVVFE